VLAAKWVYSYKYLINVTLMWKKINVFKALVRKSDGKRPHRSPRRNLSDNIKIDQKEIGRLWYGFIWLRIGTSGKLLWRHKNLTFGFRKLSRISWVAEELDASKERQDLIKSISLSCVLNVITIGSAIFLIKLSFLSHDVTFHNLN